LGSCEGNESTVREIYDGIRDANTREEWEDSSRDFFPPPDENLEHHVKAIAAARKEGMALVDSREKIAQLVAEVKQIRDTKKAEIEALRLINPNHPDVIAFDWRWTEFDKMIGIFREGRETDEPLDKDMIDAWVLANMKRYPGAAINICKVTLGEGGIPKYGEEKKSITDTSRQVLPLFNAGDGKGMHIKDEDLLRVGVPLPDGKEEEDVTRYSWIPFGDEPSKIDSKSYEGEAKATLAALDIANGCGTVLNKSFFGAPKNEEGQLHEFGALVILGYKEKLANKTWGMSRGLQPQLTRSIMQNFDGLDLIWLDPPSRQKKHIFQAYSVSTSSGTVICNVNTLKELSTLISCVGQQFFSSAERASLSGVAGGSITLSASVIGGGRPVRAIEYNDEVITICVAPFIEGKSEGKPGDIMNQELLSAILGSKRSMDTTYIIFVGEELNLDSIVAIPVTIHTTAKWLRVGTHKTYNFEMGSNYLMCSVDGVGDVKSCLYDEKEHSYLGQAGDVLNVDVLDKIRNRRIKHPNEGTAKILSIFNSKKEADTHEPMGIAVDIEKGRLFIGGHKVVEYPRAELLAGQAVTGTMAVGDLYTQEYNTLDGEYDPVVGALFPRAQDQNPAFAQRVAKQQEKILKKAREEKEKEERAKNKRSEEPATSTTSKRTRRSTRKV